MTDAQNKKCHAIIHSCAIACGAGNVAPVPGLGVAADIVALTTMTTSLAAVFGGDLTVEAAKGIAIGALKKQVLKQPIKVIGKELSKFIPGLGQVVAPTISIALIEAAGWAIAKQLEREYSN
ncbi:hypothetical protein [Brachyspira catarrhinii]|uniref:DUF697 domain-containing protein n=1 Tax=Brachyspira catarrhinii TaxID=2528966 RepID=A0ABY2TPG6_9SPIR|nr:hypothetical protein [Brachyspira catarrhinii]TKZ26050.1 hypothetical protein EZH24_12330 [Brachyspira catarrhinii]